jgi:hypothetical protein
MRKHQWIATLSLAAGLVAWNAAQAGDEHPHGKSGHQEKATHGEEGHPAGSHDSESGAHSHERAMLHGGQVTMTEQHHFETVFAPDGVRIYLYGRSQVPMASGKATAKVGLRYQDGSTAEIEAKRVEPKEGEPTAYFCPGHPDATQMEPGICAQCGTMELMKQDYLFAPVDLSEVKPGTLKATVRVSAMSGEEAEAVFTETYLGHAKQHDVEEEKETHQGHSH